MTAATHARRIIDCLNRRDLETLESLVRDDVVDEVMPVGRLDGVGSVIDFFRQMLDAFVDLHIAIEHVTEAGDTAIVQWTITGSFTGRPFLGLHPNGRRAEVRGVDVMQFDGALLRRNTIYYDGATLARELGVLPPRGSVREAAMTAAFNAATRTRSLLGRVTG